MCHGLGFSLPPKQRDKFFSSHIFAAGTTVILSILRPQAGLESNNKLSQRSFKAFLSVRGFFAVRQFAVRKNVSFS